jgi:hypothetical protein
MPTITVGANCAALPEPAIYTGYALNTTSKIALYVNGSTQLGVSCYGSSDVTLTAPTSVPTVTPAQRAAVGTTNTSGITFAPASVTPRNSALSPGAVESENTAYRLKFHWSSDISIGGDGTTVLQDVSAVTSPFIVGDSRLRWVCKDGSTFDKFCIAYFNNSSDPTQFQIIAITTALVKLPNLAFRGLTFTISPTIFTLESAVNKGYLYRTDNNKKYYLTWSAGNFVEYDVNQVGADLNFITAFSFSTQAAGTTFTVNMSDAFIPAATKSTISPSNLSFGTNPVSGTVQIGSLNNNTYNLTLSLTQDQLVLTQSLADSSIDFIILMPYFVRNATRVWPNAAPPVLGVSTTASQPSITIKNDYFAYAYTNPAYGYFAMIPASVEDSSSFILMTGDFKYYLTLAAGGITFVANTVNVPGKTSPGSPTSLFTANYGTWQLIHRADLPASSPGTIQPFADQTDLFTMKYTPPAGTFTATTATASTSTGAKNVTTTTPLYLSLGTVTATTIAFTGITTPFTTASLPAYFECIWCSPASGSCVPNSYTAGETAKTDTTGPEYSLGQLPSGTNLNTATVGALTYGIQDYGKVITQINIKPSNRISLVDTDGNILPPTVGDYAYAYDSTTGNITITTSGTGTVPSIVTNFLNTYLLRLSINGNIDAILKSTGSIDYTFTSGVIFRAAD